MIFSEECTARENIVYPYKNRIDFTIPNNNYPTHFTGNMRISRTVI